MSLLALGSTLTPAFPPGCRAVAVYGDRSPITVAGPRRIHTGFLGPPSPCPAHPPRLPEPLSERAEWEGTAPAGPGDPADQIVRDESVPMAFLVVLEAMTPAERVAFVLHDVFRYPFAEIAEVLDRRPPPPASSSRPPSACSTRPP